MSSEGKEMDISKGPAQQDSAEQQHECGLTRGRSLEPSIKPEETRQEVMKGEESYRKCRIAGEIKVAMRGMARRDGKR